MSRVADERLIGFTVMISLELKAWLDDQAAQSYRGTSAEVRMILEQERVRREEEGK